MGCEENLNSETTVGAHQPYLYSILKTEVLSHANDSVQFVTKSPMLEG